MISKKFPFYKQKDAKDCGVTCLKIISKFYNKSISIAQLRLISETTRKGNSLLNLSDAAEQIGLRSLGAKLSAVELQTISLPCILHWNNNHYVVLYKIKGSVYHIADPAFGLLKHSTSTFIKHWIGNNATPNTEEGIALILEPTPKFHNSEFEKDQNNFGFSFLVPYVLKHKSFIWQLCVGLIVGSILQLIFPFLTQSIVDIGIKTKDLNFIYIVLAAQLSLFIGRTTVDILRSWILLHLSTRINIALVSDFFVKLMSLPISYFDTRLTGDILQRINDHKRIERILTSSSLNVLFSVVNLVVFSLVLIYYHQMIFFLFATGSFFYFCWIVIFLKKRRKLDFKKFSATSKEQSKVIELVSGMQEIKLHNAEKQKRWSWEYIQALLFKISIESLTLEQYQSVGSGFINELTNILITVFSAKLVIDGEITLGMLLAITYIVGQMNSPIAQLTNYIREVQDASISLERLAEIHSMENEAHLDLEMITDVPKNSDLLINKLSFRYLGSDLMVLKKLDLLIPSNQITAIVGISGSGKTTLMKLLLKFYSPSKGTIKIGNNNLENISGKSWRDECGVVMQEGYIFSDTIANNIAVGVDFVDKAKLSHAVDTANIGQFIESLPLSYNTKIGLEGMGISTGQKQRLLIARAVYKNPNILLFDEATSSLDANNEKIIMENLNIFFKNKTVVIIAHRLSTVKNANKIVVLDKGKIVEVGNHQELVVKKGNYYNLIRNQLELGN